MSKAINIGKHICLTIQEASTHARDNTWIKSFKLEGVVEENPSWLGPDYITVYTANPRMPRSFVPIHRIISATESNGSDLQVKNPVKSMSKTWTIEGRNGDSYTVTQQGNKFTCSCKGYEFRRNCRHIIKTQHGIEKS